MDFDDKEPEQVKHKRAINGAIEILNACLTSKTVKRVVYTSSGSAVGYNKGSSVVDESMWSDAEFIKSLMPVGASYYVGKTLTERAVLEFGEKHGLDIVSVIPGYVNGPFISPRVPDSVSISLAMIMGMCHLLHLLTISFESDYFKILAGVKFVLFYDWLKHQGRLFHKKFDVVVLSNEKGARNFQWKNYMKNLICIMATLFSNFQISAGDKDQYRLIAKVPMVHIDDVASSHIFLLECPEAKGRYICSSVDITIEKMSEFLSSKYPQYQIPPAE